MNPSPRVLLIRHLESDTDDLVSRWLNAKGYQLVVVNPSAGDALPADINTVDATVVYGGAESANDSDRAYLDDERAWLADCLDVGQPVFAICLGAQLLAQVLGARVYGREDGRKEIGWTEVYPAETTPALLDATTHFYQWHGEGFDLPARAVPFAVGGLFPNQAYTVGDTVIATQFHPEVDHEIIERWIRDAHADLANSPSPSALVPRQHSDTERYCPRASQWLAQVLANWAPRAAA